MVFLRLKTKRKALQHRVSLHLAEFLITNHIPQIRSHQRCRFVASGSFPDLGMVLLTRKPMAYTFAKSM
jgi:hypothetical protein